MTDNSEAQRETLWQRTKAFFQGSDAQRLPGARTFTLTLVVLLILVVAYAAVHAWTLKYAPGLHIEGTTVDEERMALLLDTVDLEDELLAPPAIAAPAAKAVLDSLEESVNAATVTATVKVLFTDTVESLVNLGLPVDDKQSSRDAATTRIKVFLSRAQAQAEALVAAPEDARDVPQRLLEVELEQARAAVLDYMAAPALNIRVNELKETALHLGYDPDKEVITTLTRLTEELEREQPNRELAAEMLRRIKEEVQRLRTSLFWSHEVLRWVEVIAWSLAGILAARLMSAGKFIGIGQYDPAWNRWWWAKVVLAPLMAVPVVAFLTYLTIDVQSGETLGIRISLKDQPIEVVVAFAFVIGMFSNQAYKFLQNMAGKILPEEDEAQQRKPPPLVVVEDTPIKERKAETVQAELEAKGFKVKVEMRETDEGKQGTVLERKPTDEKLKEGSEITLVVVKTPSQNE
jgi:hypothetical protein